MKENEWESWTFGLSVVHAQITIVYTKVGNHKLYRISKSTARTGIQRTPFQLPNGCFGRVGYHGRCLQTAIPLATVCETGIQNGFNHWTDIDSCHSLLRGEWLTEMFPVQLKLSWMRYGIHCYLMGKWPTISDWNHPNHCVSTVLDIHLRD